MQALKREEPDSAQPKLLHPGEAQPEELHPDDLPKDLNPGEVGKFVGKDFTEVGFRRGWGSVIYNGRVNE